jgi:GT2 family glycosyltransferase
LDVTVRVAITITTHNRRDELARTLMHLGRLDPAPDEILVCADGCSDGTLELLKEQPSIRTIVHERAAGSIPSRNELGRACVSDVFVSLDDDSYPLDPDFIAQVRSVFGRHRRLAVVGFAQRSDEFPESLAMSAFGHAQFVGTFANSGAAIRRDVFLELGGYPEFFFHAYEEPDFALRCVCAGWQVWYEPSLLVRHHFTAVQRNEVRTHQRHARNEFWSIVLRCPMPQLFLIAAFRGLRQLGYAARRGPAWILQEPRWWGQAIGGICRCLEQRRPLPWRRYLAWMRLVRRPIDSEVEWNALFGSAAT